MTFGGREGPPSAISCWFKFARAWAMGGGEGGMRGFWPVAALDLSKSSIQSSIGPSTLHLAPRRTKSTKPKQASLSLLLLGDGLCASSSNVPVISLNEYPSKRRRVHHRLFPPLSLTNLFLPLHIIQVAGWPCWPCLLCGRVGRWDNVRVPIVSPRPPPSREPPS